MRALALIAAGIVCLGGAAALGSLTRSSANGGAAASLGGARVLVVDALFLRAEALRRKGRVEEVPAIYRRILELDPRSEAAVDFLADTEAHDLLGLAPTPDARFRWWEDAFELVTEAVKRNPDSARLAWRAADLLLYVPEARPEIAARLELTGRDRLFEALLHLVAAARLTESLPRLGFIHLEGVARLAPRLAAIRFAKGESVARVDEVLALGEEVLRLRAEALDSFLLDPEPAPPPSAAYRLRGGVNLVRGLRERLAASPPDRAGARDLLDAYISVVGRDPVARALEPLLPP